LESQAMRKIKNEFMSNWDGLRTKEHERVLVLAATNRPFDLDEAVVRRLPRRLLVDLPDAPNRALILKVLLAKEAVEDNLDVEKISKETEGYSGSDLKQLCLAAAFRPIRELLEKEKADKAKGLPAPATGADAQVGAQPTPSSLSGGVSTGLADVCPTRQAVGRCQLHSLTSDGPRQNMEPTCLV
jgi:SpoVK/Ycf46/Vps4 family AAA+-type ATPase